MTAPTLPTVGDAEATFRARTPRSAALFEHATRAMPGGSTRSTVYFAPYPPYIDHGSGAHLTDIDGNVYLDLLNNYTSLILGHAHPDVVAAVVAQVGRGSAFGAPTGVEVALADEIESRVQSVDELRFTNSGTEATMFALRLARAATGRAVIAKFEGAYHGTHDYALAGSRGIPEAVNALVVELPWDDMAGVRERLAGRERELAAIIIEPVQGAGGVRPATPGFLAELRAFTERHGIILVFDEIICFRIGYHGAQGEVGVTPDLTTFGKIVGGGYALAAFGGRADLMDLLDVRRPGAIVHGGTFNGNPVAAAAGLATLRHLTPARFEELNARGAALRVALAEGFTRAGLDAAVTGAGSLFHVHLGGVGSRSAACQASLQQAFHLSMINDGYYLAPRGMGALSTPMTRAEIDGLADAVLRNVQGVLAGADRG